MQIQNKVTFRFYKVLCIILINHALGGLFLGIGGLSCGSMTCTWLLLILYFFYYKFVDLIDALIGL